MVFLGNKMGMETISQYEPSCLSFMSFSIALVDGWDMWRLGFAFSGICIESGNCYLIYDFAGMKIRKTVNVQGIKLVHMSCLDLL